MDLDAEFALFEQEIGGLEDEAPAETTVDAEDKKDTSSAAESSHKDVSESSRDDKSAGFKRSVQTVSSSAPVVSSGQDEAPQVNT